MNLSTQALLSNTELKNSVNEVIQKTQASKIALIEFCRNFDDQSKIVKESMVQGFNNDSVGFLMDVKAIANGTAASRNEILNTFNKNAWSDVKAVLANHLAAVTVQKFSAYTIDASEIPEFNDVELTKKLDLVSDLQKSLDQLHSVKTTLVEKYNINPAHIGEGFKVVDLDLNTLVELHTALGGLMAYGIVNIQSRKAFIEMAQKNILPELNELKFTHGKFLNSLLEVTFFKNGAVQVRTGLGIEINKFL